MRGGETLDVCLAVALGMPSGDYARRTSSTSRLVAVIFERPLSVTLTVKR